MAPLHFSRLSRFYLSGATIGMERWLIVISAALVLLGTIAVFRARRRELVLLPAFPLVYAVVMYLGRAPMFEWYLSPMLLCCMFLIGLGVGEVVLWAGVRDGRRAIRAAAVACLAAVALPSIAGELRALPRRVPPTAGLSRATCPAGRSPAAGGLSWITCPAGHSPTAGDL